MGATYTSLHFHIVFSTKDRRPFIAPTWRESLYAYMGGTIRGLDGVAEAIGGVEDHVHLLVGLKPVHRPSDFMRELKKATSVWSIEQHEPQFNWQDGYAAFTVSPSHCDRVRKYIATQEEHHRKMGFINELKQLLTKNGVRYDEAYLL
jgi:REP-associated tyrosine transposase